MAIRVITDSTADLPEDVTKDLGITVVPLTVHFGQETFLDGIDLGPDEFFHRLSKEPQLPTTSQPSPGAFLEVYKSFSEAGDQLVSIHVSSKLSGTMNSALQAKEQLGYDQLEVLDSLQVTLGLGLVVAAAARAAKDGASFENVIQVTKQTTSHVQMFGLLDTLEYLQKGGRIGKVRGFVGSMLRVRPILTVADGLVESVISVRSRARGLQYMLTIAEERAPLQQAAVSHATTPEEAAELTAKIRPLVSDGKVIEARFGPVLGTYVGPGAIGLMVQSEKT